MADRWLVTALTSNDGIGKFQDETAFLMAPGQNGCGDAAEVYDANGAATALEFDTLSQATYQLDHKSGLCTVRHDHTTQSANGAGAAALRLYVPYISARTINEWDSGMAQGMFGGTAYLRCTCAITGTASRFTVFYSDTGSLQDNSFSNTNDYIHASITYKAF